MIHLDTSFLIRALVPGTTEDVRLREWLRAYESLAISTIAWSEFLCGPATEEQSDLAARIVPERTPFDEVDARLSARLFNETGRRRGSITDCMIAASAMNSRARLATANEDDFRRLERSGLVLA